MEGPKFITLDSSGDPGEYTLCLSHTSFRRGLFGRVTETMVPQYVITRGMFDLSQLTDPNRVSAIFPAMKKEEGVVVQIRTADGGKWEFENNGKNDGWCDVWAENLEGKMVTIGTTLFDRTQLVGKGTELRFSLFSEDRSRLLTNALLGNLAPVVSGSFLPDQKIETQTLLVEQVIVAPLRPAA